MKKIAGAIISIGLSLSFLGCSWEVPQNISVKTNAKYEFSLGNYKKAFEEDGEKLDLSTIMGTEGDGETIKVFEYFPGRKNKNLQQYIMDVKFPKSEIELTESTLNSIPENGSFTLDSQNIEGKMNLGFNPGKIREAIGNALGNDVGNNIELKSIPMYIFVNATDGLEFQPTSTMKFGYGNGDGDIESANPEEITSSFDNAVVNYTEQDGVVITDFTNINPSASKDIKNIINTTSSQNLCIQYKFITKPKTFTKRQLENKIKVYVTAIVIVPIDLKVKNTATTGTEAGVVIDLSGLTGNTPGTSEESTEDNSDNMLNKILDAVETVDLNFIVKTFPLQSTTGDVSLLVNLFNDDNSEHWHSAILKGSEQSITLKSDEIKKIKDFSSLAPALKIKMPQGAEFSLPREKNVDLDLGICLKTNGEISLSDN